MACLERGLPERPCTKITLSQLVSNKLKYVAHPHEQWRVSCTGSSNETALINLISMTRIRPPENVVFSADGTWSRFSGSPFRTRFHSYRLVCPALSDDSLLRWLHATNDRPAIKVVLAAALCRRLGFGGMDSAC